MLRFSSEEFLSCHSSWIVFETLKGLFEDSQMQKWLGHFSKVGESYNNTVLIEEVVNT
jgi:hypothetical protein